MSPSSTKVIQIPKGAAVKLSSKSAGSKTSKKSTDEERVKSMVKSLIKEIDNHGEQIKANIATKKTFAAESKVAKLNQRAKAVSSRVIKKALSGNVDKRQVELKSAVHAEILKRGVGKSILKLGRGKPIRMLATTSVKLGLSNHSLLAKSSIKPKRPADKNPKMIAKELQTVKLLSPSEIKSKNAVAAAKTTINTQIVKRAMIKEVRSSVRRISPTVGSPKVRDSTLHSPKTVASKTTKKFKTSPHKR